MTSYILDAAEQPKDAKALKQALHKAFEGHAARLPTDGAEVFSSINASVAVRLFALMYMRGLQHALMRDDTSAALCEALRKVVCGIEIEEKFDDMFVSNFVLGLIVFLDLIQEDLEPEARAELVAKIAECRDWLSEARHRKVFGRRETEGTYAWNHSACAAAGLALSVIWSRDGQESWTETDFHDVDFGLRRIEDYFLHGIRETGVPYEGFYYCGAVFRVFGPFDILVQKDAEVDRRYRRIRARHGRKLGQLLDWFESGTIVNQRGLLSFNHSLYDSHPAVNGFLTFFRSEYKVKAGRMWSRLIARGTSLDFVERSRDWGDNTLHEALLFLHPKGYAAPRRKVQTLLSKAEGYGLLVSEDFGSRLFVKASKLLVGPHNQSDAGHVSWVCNGDAVLIDAGPGRKVRDASKKWAEYSKGTYRTEGSGASSYGHNAILIDDRGQLPSGEGEGIEGRIRYARQADGCWCVGTDARAAYNKDDYNPVEVADRHIVFPNASGQYLVLMDRVIPRMPGTYRFRRLLHFAHPTDVTEEDGPGRMAVTIGKTVYDLWTLSPSGALSTGYEEEKFQLPIRTRGVLDHALRGEDLWLYTVIAARGSAGGPTDVSLQPRDGAAAGADLRLVLEGGQVQTLTLSEQNDLAVTLTGTGS